MEAAAVDPAIVAHNLRLSAELVRILTALDRAQIPTIVLKGLPLMQRIGISLAERRVTDNDVLVRLEDVHAAVAVLTSLGYTAFDERSLDHDLRVGFEHVLVRPEADGGFLVCEVHWHAFPPTLFGVSPSVLWERCERTTVDGVEMRIFEPILQLLHLTSHALQHELCEPRTIRVFGKAWQRWQAEIAHADLVSLANELGMRDALEYLVAVVENLDIASASKLESRSRRVAQALSLLPPRRLLEPAENRYPERYFRFLVTLLLVPPERAVAHLGRRIFPAVDPTTAEGGRGARVRHYAMRPMRPLLRSLGFRPTPGRGSNSWVDARGTRLLGPTLKYVATFRTIGRRYSESALDELLARLDGGASEPSLSFAELERAIRVAERLAPRISSTPNTCLFRALSRFALLRHYGHPAAFVLGLGTAEEPGHAWVEVAGGPFLEPAVPAFPRIYTYESRRG